MKNPMKKLFPTKQDGYIALMATIVISLILLVMTVEESQSGWSARFNILGTEAKEQASALAEGCADQALAKIIIDPTYAGNTSITTSGGTCHIFPIVFDTPSAGFVTIKTQAEVRNSFANLNTATNLNDIHVGSTPSAPSKGTLVVITQVINDSSGTKLPSDFTMHVTGTNPSETSFNGSDSGVVVTVDPIPAGNYKVTESPMVGYATTVSTNCDSTISGNIAAGEIKFCTITNDDITTTLTVIANVKNDNSGTKQPADFPLFIDGTAVTLGARVSFSSAASHTVSATTLSGYAASTWGYDCATNGTVSLNLGENKTCIINFDDLPPPAPICAETVMILDRTGSMSSADLSNERAAATSLVNLYSTVTPLPKIGVGSIGGLYGNSAAQVPDNTHAIVGWLTTVYNTITNAITTMTGSNSSVGSDLSAGITVGNVELTGPRHVAGKEKVLILVSDGVPNQPSGSTNYDTGFKSPLADVQNGSGEVWTSPTGAYTDGGADANDPVSENDRHRFYNFGFGGGAGLPTGSNLNGIEATVDAWNTTSAGTVTTTLVPSSMGLYDEWTPNTGTDVSSVSTNDSDTSYIDTSSNIDSFTVPNSGLPSGSTINSVTITATARGTVANQTLQLIAEKGSGGANLSIGPTNTLTTTYAPYTRVLTTNPFTGNPWTLGEVNSWTTKFGVRTTNGQSVRVTQVSVAVNYSPPNACQLGVDLSWNGGSNWSNEKTQTLSGVETSYTLGTPSDDWTSSHTWQPTDFSDANFRARIHAINSGSSCSASAVDHVDWLQLKVHYSQPVDPTLAAYNAADLAKQSGTQIFTIHFGDSAGRELLARLASGNTSNPPHENGSYSDPGGVVNGNSGLISPSAHSADTGGDGDGFEVTPTNAFADGPSGVGGAAQNQNGAGDRHRYSGYNFSVAPNATMVGLETRLDWWLDSTSGTNSMGVELSWDGGTTWTAMKTDGNESTSVSNSRTLGSSADTWGHVWTLDQLSNANFRVRLTSNSTVSTRDFFLDWVPVKVYYSVIQENGDGDNFFISPTSADMQGIFNFIGEQVCPALLNLTPPPPPTTATIIVMTKVINDNSGSLAENAFTAHVTASSPSQATITGSASATTITVNPGTYNIYEDDVTGYLELPGATCSSDGSSGPIVAGETRVCILTNDDVPPPPPPPNFNINTGSWQEVPTGN